MKKGNYTTVLIPAFEPNEQLISYVRELKSRNFGEIIIVDDGSGEAYRAIFEEIQKLYGCIVIVHEENRGKGAALKTGYAYIQNHLPDCNGVITADSDGQHSAEDVEKMASAILQYPDGLVLGEREFAGKHVPLRSSIGNRSTSFMLYLLFGKKLKDTQTGLRGMSKALLSKMIEIPGERFEYEMQVLIECVHSKIPIHGIPIQTIYEDNNRGTHYNPIRDSIRIGRVLFGNFVKFISSSFVCAILDFLIACLAFDLLQYVISGKDLFRIFLATAIARSCSIGVNYTINKNLVFASKDGSKKTMLRYMSLAFGIMVLSTVLVYGAHRGIHISEKIAKPIVDTLS